MKNQQGIALIAAIFLVVVIGVALVVLATLSGRNTQQTTQNLLQMRAQSAAISAIEFGVQNILVNDACDADIPVAISAFANFNVRLQCVSADFNPASQSITLYNLNATAEFGSPADADYVWAEMSATVEL